ncbi:hypothetical protein RDI58_019787 [Solanum bulbocastanum]|uniref:Uncharacterized protein n=1 Tax=Solanum bulbocastanum TaxID=147425 RepID=A0AAN8Y7Y2_SOLBU
MIEESTIKQKIGVQ